MLDIKKLLTKILKQTSYRIVSVSATSATSVSSNTTKWLSVPLPTSGRVIAVVGYYLNGGATCSVYSIGTWSTSGASVAVRNYGSSAQNVTTTVYYMVVD